MKSAVGHDRQGGNWLQWALHLGDASIGLLILPALMIAGRPVHGSLLFQVAAVAVAVGAWQAIRLAGLDGVHSRLLGLVVTALLAWTLARVSYPGTGIIAAPALGAGLALLNPHLRWPRQPAAPLIVAVVLIALRFLLGRTTAMDAAVAEAICAGMLALLTGRGEQDEPDTVASPSDLAPTASQHGLSRRDLLAGSAEAAIGLGTLATFAYLGATTPEATWFGAMTTHGPRRGRSVSLTFDDGPNATYTQQVMAILDANSVQATFFTVGKALKQRPDISQQLLVHGHLLGNHSFTHSSWTWLDPHYPELDEAQSVFTDKLGVRPRFYRPPHGNRTPFITHALAEKGMRCIAWEVSAGDWATTDGGLVARRILDKVQAGSIILLHDGLNGDLVSDRSVVLTALPLVLKGLEARGFEIVRLDKLLGMPGLL